MTAKRGAREDAGAAQASLGDDVHLRRDEAMVKRLEQMGNVVDDLLARLPAWRREIDALIAELRTR